WLLHATLLRFVAGAALAYVLDPLADRIERLGVNRTVAALLIVAVSVIVLVGLIVLLVPLLVQQGSALLARIPGYVQRVKELIVDRDLPWLQWLGQGDPKQTVSNLVNKAAAWLLTFAYSLWTGGKALVSFASLLIVMPVVTFYLIVDWRPMIEVIDGWVPVRQRDTVRRLAGDIDVAIGAFL